MNRKFYGLNFLCVFGRDFYKTDNWRSFDIRYGGQWPEEGHGGGRWSPMLLIEKNNVTTPFGENIAHWTCPLKILG